MWPVGGCLLGLNSNDQCPGAMDGALIVSVTTRIPGVLNLDKAQKRPD